MEVESAVEWEWNGSRISIGMGVESAIEVRDLAYFGVFDGHGGKEAAKFARE